MAVSLHQLLKTMTEMGGTDLHVTTNSAPQIRVDGKLRPLDLPPLSAVETKQLAYSVLTDAQKHRFEENLELDFSFGIKGLARFRANVFSQRGAVAAVYRTIPYEIRGFKDLGLPPVIASICDKPRGLVLVTGPTGSGKSTTLAAMLDKINSERHEHMLTVEDPIEYLHQHKKCVVNQREVHADTHSFSNALRAALREDPDVVLIGEMRDLETISMAISAAETGHLVFGTLHTTSAISTVDRIIDVFPTDAQQQVRVQMSSTLQGVISQTLVPKVGGGRVAAREILVATDAVKSLIREGKSQQILNLMQTGKQHGMSTLEDELLRFYAEGLISADDTVAKANRPDDVRRRLGDIRPKQQQPVGASMGMSMRSSAPEPRPAAAPQPGLGSYGGVQGLKVRGPSR